jgi:hypothetical protein
MYDITFKKIQALVTTLLFPVMKPSSSWNHQVVSFQLRKKLLNEFVKGEPWLSSFLAGRDRSQCHKYLGSVQDNGHSCMFCKSMVYSE